MYRSRGFNKFLMNCRWGGARRMSHGLRPTTRAAVPGKERRWPVANPLAFKIQQADHRRGCDGRCYTCTCGFDEEVEAAMMAKDAEIERLQKGVAAAIEELDDPRRTLNGTFAAEIVRRYMSVSETEKNDGKA